MKVLNVNAVLDPVTGGGTAERTIQISRSLISENVDCSIMTTDLGIRDGLLKEFNDLNVYAYRCINKRFYIPLVRYSTIKEIISEVDIVHIMGHWTVLNALVYIATRSLGKPYVVCPAGALPLFGRSKILKKLYNLLIGSKIIRNASAWVAITEDEKSQFLPYGITSENITVIPNGVDLKDFSDFDAKGFKQKYCIDNNKFIMFLGRLNIIKGPDLLLDAFIKGAQDWRDWHLIYAGPDGGLLKSLKKTVQDNNLMKRVHFIGYVNGIEKSSAYHVANLLVIPSRQEAMSIVVLEAGISSTPVVITDQCGFNQIEGINGGKVSPATIDGIYTALDEVIQNNDNLLTMGKNLEKFVEENYTWSVVIHKYIDLYSNLLGKT